MATQTLSLRVDSLEQRVTRLEELPARVDALVVQISQFREEMHGEFSAVRAEIRTGDGNTLSTLREEIRAGDQETRRVLGDAIRTGLAEVMAQARTLYEAQQAAWKLLDEKRRADRRTE